MLFPCRITKKIINKFKNVLKFFKAKIERIESEMCIATHCGWATQTYYKIVTT